MQVVQEFPEEIRQKISLQSTTPSNNLTLNRGEGSFGQDECKTLTKLCEAQHNSRMAFFFKVHDNIEKKLYPEDEDKVSLGEKIDFKHLKGFTKFVEEEYRLNKSLQEEILTLYKDYSVEIEALKVMLPDNGKRFENQVPLDNNGNLMKPVVAPKNFIYRKEIEQGAEEWVYEENPLVIDSNHLTMGYKDFKESELEELVSTRAYDRFLIDLASFFYQIDSHKKAFERINSEDGGDYARRDRIRFKTGFYEDYHRRIDVAFGNNYGSSVSRIIDELGKNMKVLTGKIVEAVNQEDKKRAGELSELKRNLRTLSRMEDIDPEDKRALWHFKVDEEGLKRGKDPIEDQKAIASVYSTHAEYLEEADVNCQINYAEADDELLDMMDIDFIDGSRGSGEALKSSLKFITTNLAWSEHSDRKEKKIDSLMEIQRFKGRIPDGITYKKIDNDNYSLHFGASKGQDIDCDDWHIAGTPRKPNHVLALTHFAFFGFFPQTMEYDPSGYDHLNVPKTKVYITKNKRLGGYKEATLNKLYQHLTISEIKDSVVRPRGQKEEKDINIWIYGYCPHPVWEHFDEDRREALNLNEALVREVEGILEGRKEVPEVLQQLPALPTEEKFSSHIRKRNGKLKKTNITDREKEIIDILEGVGNGSMKIRILADYFDCSKRGLRKIAKKSHFLEKKNGMMLLK
jgi:hypothetical protein